MRQSDEKEIAGDAIIETSPVAVPTPLEVELDSKKAIARIASIAQVIDGCAKVSIQRTNASDWVRMGKSFYLQATGAQKIRPVWGIYFRDRQVTKEMNPDGSYAYIVTGKVGSKVLDQLYGEVEIEIDGGRSSSDSFFTKNGRTPDPMDIRKASLANWEARAVTALLGLKNLTEEDLKRNGITVGSITGVDYQKGAEGGGNTALISDPQRKRLFAICKSAGCDEAKLKKFLKKHFKIDTTSEITRKDYEAICKAVESGTIDELTDDVPVVNVDEGR